MWPQGAYGQQQYPQQPYQYMQPPQGPYGNAQPMNNNQIPSEVIDWEGVSSIDPDLIRMTGDLTQLQPFISKFISANLTAYESQVLSHPLSVRLCSILQVSLQYMGDVQKELLAKVEARDRQIEKQQREFKKLAASYAKADELLKKQMRPSERCPLCLKRFKNFDFLDQHVERRHPEHIDEWLSIRNKKPAPKQNQNDINAIMERIEALQNSIRKDREKQKHHSRRRRSENDENIQTLQMELHDQQDQLMATEALQDELLMTKRDDMKSELDTAVDDLNASWIAWSNNAKKNKSNQKNKENKIPNDADELNNMYKNDFKATNQFDRLEDQFELDGQFGNCQSIVDDFSKDPNYDQNPMNQFQFQMLQNDDVPYNPQQQQQQQQVQQQQQQEQEKDKSKSKKSGKKKKHLFFGRKKSKHNLNSEDNNNNDDDNNNNNDNNLVSNIQPTYSNMNEIDNSVSKSSNATSKIQKSKSKSKIVQKQSQLPPKKKVLPDDVKELIAKARTIVVRKFVASYDESTVNHVMRSIEKKMKGLKQQYGSNNESPEQITDALRTNFDGEQNDYISARRKVMLKIDNEAPVKHCTLFDSSFSESSAISTNDQQSQQNQPQTTQTKIQPKQQQKQDQNISQSSISAKKKKMKSIDDIPKPNNSQFNTSYSNYVSGSISTTLSIAKTPQEATSTRKRKRKQKPSKSSYSIITSNSNIHEVENKNQNKTNETQDPPPSNTKKLHFIKPKPAIQCKKHFKSAGHSVQSPYPMLSGTPVSSTKENINNNNDSNVNNDNRRQNNNSTSEYNNNFDINYDNNNNDFGINQNFANYNNNNNINNVSLNQKMETPNDEIFYRIQNQEVEYVYDEEEEEEEEDEVNFEQVNINANEDIVFDEVEEPNVTENNAKTATETQDLFEEEEEEDMQQNSQQFISTEVKNNKNNNNVIDNGSFSLSKSLNKQEIEAPKYIKRAKNEMTSSTDPMFEVPQDSRHQLIQQQQQQQKNPEDSLDQSSFSNSPPRASKQQQQQKNQEDSLNQSTISSSPQQEQEKVTQQVQQAPQNEQPQYEYEYEYYTDETEGRSDAEAASMNRQSEQIEQLEQEEKSIEQEEVQINAQFQQQKEKERSDLEPFTISSQDQPLIPSATSSHSHNSSIANANNEIENECSNPSMNNINNSGVGGGADDAQNCNNNRQAPNSSFYTKSEYYSSSSTNLFYKFDSSVTLSKSKSKESSNENENLIENNSNGLKEQEIKSLDFNEDENEKVNSGLKEQEIKSLNFNEDENENDNSGLKEQEIKSVNFNEDENENDNSGLNENEQEIKSLNFNEDENEDDNSGLNENEQEIESVNFNKDANESLNAQEIKSVDFNANVNVNNNKKNANEAKKLNLIEIDSEEDPEAEVQVEVRHSFANPKEASNEPDKPDRRPVYQSPKRDVGSMDNIVSFDDAKSIESIEQIQSAPKKKAPNVHVSSASNSEFDFDSLVAQSNGGDSFMSGSTSKSFRARNSRTNSQISPQSVDPSSYNVTNSTDKSNNNNDSFISRQRNILASKYGNAQATNSNAKVVAAPVTSVPQNEDEYEYVEEEEEEEEEEFEEKKRIVDNVPSKSSATKYNNNSNNENLNEPSYGGGNGGKKFNVIDLFKQSSNSSFTKIKKTNSKSFLGSKLQKTFAGSSSAPAEDDDEFDYSRGPPMKNKNDTFNDEDFESESNLNVRVHSESYIKTNSDASKFVDDPDGPPMLSNKKNFDSIISNDDFNL